MITSRVQVRASRQALAAAGAMGALLAMAACGGGKGSTSTGAGGHTGTGGSTGTGAMSGMLSSASPATTDAAHALALDATLSNDGTVVYFTAVGANGPGVYSVPASGGSVTPVLEGAPLAAPFGIALSTDGKKLYVADPGAAGPTKDQGRILEIDAEGGSATPVAGTEDILPRALDIVAESGKDQIYFAASKVTGSDTSGAVYKIPAAGGTAKVVASGTPLVDPEGIAVTKDGKVYVLDAIGAGTGRAAVFEIDSGTAATFVSDLRVGYPSGLALSLDEKSLLVSSIDAKKSSAVLTIIDIFSKELTSFPTDMSLDMRFEVGGLHRARAAETFAWVSPDPAGASVLIVK